MKQLKMTALALALTSIATGSAMAQSSKTNAWEGFAADIGVGYGNFAPKLSGGNAGPWNTVPAGTPLTDQANSVNTGVARLAVGYNYGINSDYVIGIGASYYPGASSSATGAFGVGGPPNSSFTYNVKNIYSVFLTPGYVIDKDRLVYAKVGYAGSTMGLNSPTLAYSTLNLTGYNLGLGYKQMLTQSIYFVGEANYTSMSNKTANVTTTYGLPLSAPIGATGYDFLVGVGYRF